MKAQQQATLPKSPDQRRAQYHAYLRTPEWQAKRLAALERADHRCQVCNASKRLDVHHRTYERIFQERPGDLTVLCRDCHERFHGITVQTPAKAKRKKAERRKDEIMVAIPEFLRARPGATRQQVAQFVGITPGQAGGYLGALNGKTVAKLNKRWFALDSGKAAVLPAQPWRPTAAIY